jgi:hypothetical protein
MDTDRRLCMVARRIIKASASPTRLARQLCVDEPLVRQ